MRFDGPVALQYANDVANMFIGCARSGYRGAAACNLRNDVVEVADFVAMLNDGYDGAAITHVTGQPLPFPADLDDGGLRGILGDVPHTPLAQAANETIEAFRRLLEAGKIDAGTVGRVTGPKVPRARSNVQSHGREVGPTGVRMMDLSKVQAYLREQGVDGWLLYNFRDLNPIAAAVAGLSWPGTRRWFLWIPAAGEPRWLVHAIERQVVHDAHAQLRGEILYYVSWEEMAIASTCTRWTRGRAERARVDGV